MRVNFTQKVFAFLKMYAFLTLFLGIIFLVYAFPNYPKSISQWAWFLLLGARFAGDRILWPVPVEQQGDPRSRAED